MASVENMEALPPTPPHVPSWWQRNRRWFIPAMILSPIVLCCLPCGGCFYIGRQNLVTWPPYVAAMDVLQGNPAVRDVLGENVRDVGWMPIPIGDVKTGPIQLQIQVRGTKARGTAIADVELEEGQWRLTALEVRQADGPTIKVIEKEGADKAQAAGGEGGANAAEKQSIPPEANP